MKVWIYIYLIVTCSLPAGSLFGCGRIIPVKKELQYPVPVKWQSGTSQNPQLRLFFQADGRYSWEQLSVETDINGLRHTRFQQLYDAIPVTNAVVILHEGSAGSYFITGIFTPVSPSVESLLNFSHKENDIVRKFLIPGSKILHDLPGTGWQWVIEDSDSSVRLAFAMSYFPEKSLQPLTTLVDPVTMTKIHETQHSCFANVTGIAITSYQGTQSISCYSDSGRFYIKSTAKGLGIFTGNLNHNLNYQHITEFTDDDNFWQQGTVTDENYATAAQYCAEKYYDFLNSKFSRNSLDNNGFRLLSYLNYGSGMANAFWNGQAVVYGTGNNTSGPLTTLDITGHEFTHGLIQKTANLVYNGEPGTLNEAISDIFGTALEFHTNPQQANWLIGEQTGSPLRSFSNPETYNQPSVYHGNLWYYGTGDQGGVHINSGFINKWFYVLANGEQGINEFGTSYNVTGIGINKSTDVVYHTLTSFLIPTSGFEDFYEYTLQSAIDLYGNCSPEYASVLAAWEAVQFGNYAFTPLLIHSGNTNFCTGDSVFISVPHVPGSQYEWFCNGVSVYNGTDPGLFVKTPGGWMVQVSRCGQLYDSDYLNLINFPLVPVSTQNIEVCKGVSVELAGYPAGGIFNIPNPYYGNSTLYEYNFTDVNGCRISATGTILVHDLPIVEMTTPSAIIPVNATPMVLYANVPGTFYGAGVAGNMFSPAEAGIGGPYPVYVSFTDFNGCSALDSIAVEVVKPCIKEFVNYSIEASDSIVTPGQSVSFHISASDADFQFEWILPEGCIALGPITSSDARVIWSALSGKVILRMINSCNDTVQKEFRIRVHQPVENVRFTLFPNPAKGNVFFMLTGSEKQLPSEITITDVSGKVIDKFIMHHSIFNYTIENLTPGFYAIELKNGNNLLRERLIVY